MRRKRRKTGTWFPLLGTPETGQPSALTFQLAVDTAINGDATVGIIPITYDYPQEGQALQSEVDTLSEIVGNEYIIKRILGNVVVTNDSRWNGTLFSGAADAILVTAGFFVARAGSDTQGPLGADAPIGYGADTTSSDLEQYSPGCAATAREPWMWRRTWVLGNAKRWQLAITAGGNTNNGVPFAAAPASNVEGSHGHGTSIDIKSRRRVRLDERLFFAVEARNLPLGVNSTLSSSAYVALTIRMFGSLVKARNSGAF